jgi:hypothetical protein
MLPESASKDLRINRARVVFPEPDSPTITSAFPLGNVSVTSSTAFLYFFFSSFKDESIPSEIVKYFFIWLTSIIFLKSYVIYYARSRYKEFYSSTQHLCISKNDELMGVKSNSAQLRSFMAYKFAVSNSLIINISIFHYWLASYNGHYRPAT